MRRDEKASLLAWNPVVSMNNNNNNNVECGRSKLNKDDAHIYSNVGEHEILFVCLFFANEKRYRI